MGQSSSAVVLLDTWCTSTISLPLDFYPKLLHLQLPLDVMEAHQYSPQMLHWHTSIGMI